MAFTDSTYYSAGGGGYGWRLSGSLVELAKELNSIAGLTCVGTLGNTAHVDEGWTASDHNPFVVGPDGLGVVRAIDVNGPDDVLKQIRQRMWDLYNAHDPRLWPFGYAKGCSDNLINNWTDAGQAPGTHEDDGDAGHLHLSVTQTDGNNPQAGTSGYVAAIDSAASWGIAAQAPPAPTPPPKPTPAPFLILEDDDMYGLPHIARKKSDTSQSMLVFPSGLIFPSEDITGSSYENTIYNVAGIEYRGVPVIMYGDLNYGLLLARSSLQIKQAQAAT